MSDSQRCSSVREARRLEPNKGHGEARSLREWGLRNGTTPLDPESSLAADDRHFLSEYAGNPVSGAVLFPIMNATDDLGAAGELIEWRPRSKNAHVAALLTVCRAAAESAARTIWLLSDIDRAVRRSSCVRFEASELDNQRGFNKSERDWFASHPKQRGSQTHRDFEKHIELFDKRVEMLKRGMQLTPKVSVPGSTEVVTIAAQWIGNNPPAHDPQHYNNDFPRSPPVSIGWVRGSCTVTSGQWITSKPRPPVIFTHTRWRPRPWALRWGWRSAPSRYTRLRHSATEHRPIACAITRSSWNRRSRSIRRSTTD